MSMTPRQRLFSECIKQAKLEIKRDSNTCSKKQRSHLILMRGQELYRGLLRDIKTLKGEPPNLSEVPKSA